MEDEKISGMYFASGLTCGAFSVRRPRLNCQYDDNH